MRTIIMALAALILSTGFVLAEDLSKPRAFQGSYWYIIDHVVDVAPDAEVTLLLVVPDDFGQQTISLSNIVPSPDRVVTDPDHGNKIVIWKVKPQPGEEQIFFRFDFTGRAHIRKTDVDPELVEATDRKSDLWRTYTRNETWIETGGAVAAKAAAIVGDRTNPYFQARAIFDWMIESLEFVPGGTDDRGAAKTLATLKGDCGQYSHLFIALCRSLGIPARTITNVWFDGGVHCYAEFHVEPYGWIPADVSAAQALVPGHTLFDQTDRKAFRLLRGIGSEDPFWLFGNLYRNQMTLTVGNNIEIPALGGRVPAVYTAMRPGGADASPEAIVIKGLNDDVIHGGFFVFDRKIDQEQALQIIHQKLANQFFSAGLVDAVEDGCFMAQQEFSDGVMTWMNLGRVNLHKKNYSRAEACFLRAINEATVSRSEKLESMIWAHNYLGNCYDLMGRRERALAEYQVVLNMGIDYRGSLAYAVQYLAKPFED